MGAPALLPVPGWSLRSLLRDPAHSDEERAAFVGFTAWLTRLCWPLVGYGLAAAVVVWWPLDLIVYADDARVRAGLVYFRLWIAGIAAVSAFMMPRLAAARRDPQLAAIGVALLSLAGAGWFLAELGQGSPLWLYYCFIIPMFSVLLLIPLGARLVTSLAFSGVISGVWLSHPAASLETPGVAAGLSFMVFSSLLAVGIGHALFLTIRHSFHLRQRVESQRADLEQLAERLEERVSEQTQALRSLHERSQGIRTQQRRELARELHDGLGQELVSLRLLVGVGRQVLDGEAADEVMGELDGQLSRVQQTMRRVLVALRPQLLDEQGLTEALRVLLSELERRSGLSMSLSVRGPTESLPAPVSVALYRISQEALTNVLRHARARSAELSLSVTAAAVALEVTDDGIGVPADRLGAGLGTLGITERAEALGGRARWEGGAGTTLSVTIPLSEHP